jgi:hypothetical protein
MVEFPFDVSCPESFRSHVLDLFSRRRCHRRVHRFRHHRVPALGVHLKIGKGMTFWIVLVVVGWIVLGFLPKQTPPQN